MRVLKQHSNNSTLIIFELQVLQYFIKICCVDNHRKWLY